MNLTKLQNISLILLFFSTNFEVWDPINSGGFFSFSKLFGIIYFLTILPSCNKFFVLPSKMIGILVPLFLFYILLLLMNIFNIGYISSDFLSTSILLNIIFFIIIVNHERLSPGVIEKAFIGFLVGALFLTFAFYFKIGVEVTIDKRVSLFGDDQNIIGMRMVVATFLLTHYLTSYRNILYKPVIILMCLAYIPIITLLLNTGSRVATISLFIGLSFFIILYKFKRFFVKVFVIIVFLSISGILVEYILSSEVLGSRLMKTIDEGNLAGRDNIWKAILPLIGDNILFGVGQTGYIEFAHNTFGGYKSPHNVIIEVLSYTGIIGLFLYLIFIYKAFWSSLKYFIRYNELIPLLFAIPVLGLLLSGQILVLKLGWFILAYAATRKFYNLKLINQKV